MTQPLTWALVVATYQREQILPLCLKLAVEQTRPPVEVIVVDASDHWEQTRDRVLAEIAKDHPKIRWEYVAAKQRGLPLQRNQGLDLATADIVFLIDDDSLMYPDCAEQIMRVYEADSALRVVGVQAALAEAMPTETAVQDDAKPVGWKQNQWTMKINPVQHFVWKNIFLMNNEVTCIPYYGTFPQHDVPAEVGALNVHPMRLFHGCRMTYRREVIGQERFEPLLLYYALNEDMDASYRVSKHGLLLEAGDAQLFHCQSNSGRLSRYVVTVLSLLNQAVCVRRYSDDLKRDRRRFYVLMVRRILSEFCKDGLSRRWDFPQLRGVLTGFRYAPIAFRLPLEELTQWYPQFQKAFVETGKPPVT